MSLEKAHSHEPEEDSMDGMLWQLVLVNIVTPNFPFIFPLRMATTIAAVDVYPWWVVLIIANLSGGIGMLPIYAIARWTASAAWQRKLGSYARLRLLQKRWRRNMFVIQILMNGTPLPDFVSSGLAGCERYSVWKFLLSQLIGRTLHNGPLVLGGFFLSRYPWFSWAVRFIQQPTSVIMLAGLALLWWLATRSSSKNTETVE